MGHVEQAIKPALKDCECEKGASVMEPVVHEAQVIECQEFVKWEGKLRESEA